MKKSFVRELQEELSIEVEEVHIKIVHIAHRISDDRTYFNIFAEIEKYKGEIKNTEPSKCSELQYLNPHEASDIVAFNREVLDFIEEAIYSSQQFDR